MASRTILLLLVAAACITAASAVEIGTTVVDTKGDAMEMPGVKKAGWNAMRCPRHLLPEYMGACSAANCTKAGIPAKWKTAFLHKNKIGVEVYVKGNPTTVKKASAQTCCNTCAATPGCTYWQYIPDITLGGKRTLGACFLTHNDIEIQCGELVAQYDTSSMKAEVQIRSGGECNPNAEVLNDPHFTGAHGTRFDFNGVPDKAYCLLTDAKVHMNVKLRGYYDDNTEGASMVAGGKAIRTWIKETGLVWTAAGADHTLRLVARDGKKQERGDGFMAKMEVDGKALPRLAVGEEVTGAGGLTIKLLGLEKEGQFDVDHYHVAIAGVIAFDVRMRVAHPLLQTPTDAEAHMNIAVTELEPTEEVHGVLGQTYREDHVQRAMDFQRVISMLHHPIAADGETGKGFLDGTPRSYEASTVLAPDCAHTVYHRAGIVTPVTQYKLR